MRHGREDEYKILLDTWEELSKKKMLLMSLQFGQATVRKYRGSFSCQGI